MKKITIFAPTVRSFGATALVQALVDAEKKCNFTLEFYVANDIPLARKPTNCRTMPSGLVKQLQTERNLLRNAASCDTLLYFTNRPPIRASRSFCATIILSAFAIETPKDVPTTLARAIKSRLQRQLNKSLGKNTDVFITRSEYTSNLVEKETGVKAHFYPFMTNSVKVPRSIATVKKSTKHAFTFFYPADASVHKNHSALIKAWKTLHAEKINASLILTISHEKARTIDENYLTYGVQATGYLTDQEIINLYQGSDALIFPSLIESFPLPLIEARKHNLPIVASERDYIREQVDPEESFDPLSSTSIKMAVKRFMGLEDVYAIKPDALDFLNYAAKMQSNCKMK